VDFARLEVSWQIAEELIHGLARGNTIVSDKRESDDEDLAAVRRIRDGLRIANHTRLEDQLSSNALLSTKAVALEGGAIFKLEADEAIILGANLTRRGGRLRNQSHCNGYGNGLELKQNKERKKLRCWAISTRYPKKRGATT
jgi:hypothetical protein